MKKIFLIVITLLLTMTMYSKVIRTEYKKGINNTYKLEYTDIGRVVISNVIDPLENKNTDSYWRDKIDIVSLTGNPKTYVYEYLNPELQQTIIDENDYSQSSIGLYLDYGLNGQLKRVTFAYSSKIKEIPLSTFEQLETKLKEEIRMTLKYDSNKIGDIQYVSMFVAFSLKAIKHKIDRGELIDPDTQPKPLP